MSVTGLEHINIEALILHARDAQENAYVPYSNFKVGAAVLSEKNIIFTGANIENASFGLTSCAERNAIFNAVHQGLKSIIAICVVGNTAEPISPCGACRQVIREFADKNIAIILVNQDTRKRIFTLEEILPYSFGPEHISKLQIEDK